MCVFLTLGFKKKQGVPCSSNRFPGPAVVAIRSAVSSARQPERFVSGSQKIRRSRHRGRITRKYTLEDILRFGDLNKTPKTLENKRFEAQSHGGLVPMMIPFHFIRWFFRLQPLIFRGVDWIRHQHRPLPFHFELPTLLTESWGGVIEVQKMNNLWMRKCFLFSLEIHSNFYWPGARNKASSCSSRFHFITTMELSALGGSDSCCIAIWARYPGHWCNQCMLKEWWSWWFVTLDVGYKACGSTCLVVICI